MVPITKKQQITNTLSLVHSLSYTEQIIIHNKGLKKKKDLFILRFRLYSFGEVLHMNNMFCEISETIVSEIIQIKRWTYLKLHDKIEGICSGIFLQFFTFSFDIFHIFNNS